jgi:hypothetical protein
MSSVEIMKSSLLAVRTTVMMLGNTNKAVFSSITVVLLYDYLA